MGLTIMVKLNTIAPQSYNPLGNRAVCKSEMFVTLKSSSEIDFQIIIYMKTMSIECVLVDDGQIDYHNTLSGMPAEG